MGWAAFPAATSDPAPTNAPHRFGVRTELRRLFSPPRAELGIITLNALEVCAGWVLLPHALRDWLFDSLRGPLAFVIVLETWMMGDVTSTNMFGADLPGARTALVDAGGVRRFMTAKVAAQAMLIGPICAMAAVVVGIGYGDLSGALLLVPVLLTVPLAVPAVASWLGIVLPYRTRGLRWRWEHRRPWTGTLRWAALVLVPYTVVSALTTALVGAAFKIGRHLAGSAPGRHLSTASLVLSAPIACALSLAVFAVAPIVSGRLAMARRERLVAYFEDPDAG